MRRALALALLPVLVGCSALASRTGTTDPAPADASATAAAPGPPTVTAYPAAVTDEQVLEVVSAMDAALQSGDVEAFLARVGPALVEQQRDWFEAVRNVPMDVRQLRADKVVSRTSPVGTVLHVGFRHQVAGAGPVPVLEHYRWVLAPDQDGRAMLVEVGGRNGTFQGYPQLWDFGPVAVLEADDVVLLAPETARADAEQLLPQISEAAVAVRQDFPAVAQARDVVHVQLVPSADVEDVLDGQALMGISWLRVSPQDPGLERASLGPAERTLDPRLVLELEPMIQDLTDFGPTAGGNTYLRHLASSAAVAGDDEQYQPAGWLAYGVPTWYELAGDPIFEADLVLMAAEAHRGGPPLELPRPYWTDDEDAYAATSTSLVLHLDEVYGRASALEVVEQLHGTSGWYEESDVWPTVARTLGTSEEELLRGWQEWGEELLVRADELSPGYTEG